MYILFFAFFLSLSSFFSKLTAQIFVLKVYFFLFSFSFSLQYLHSITEFCMRCIFFCLFLIFLLKISSITDFSIDNVLDFPFFPPSRNFQHHRVLYSIVQWFFLLSFSFFLLKFTSKINVLRSIMVFLYVFLFLFSFSKCTAKHLYIGKNNVFLSRFSFSKFTA